MPFDPAQAWQEGDTIPRRLLRAPQGPCGDIGVVGRARWGPGEAFGRRWHDVALPLSVGFGRPADIQAARFEGDVPDWSQAAHDVTLFYPGQVNWPLTVAMVAIVLRAVSSGPLTRAVDHALVPLLASGVLSSLVAFAIGFRVGPWEAVSSSPLGRNHMLAAAWALAYWTLLLVMRWRGGEAVWEGVPRWVMADLALFGGLLLTITATRGGHLTGTPTAASQALRAMGWEVCTTFCVPDTTLCVIGGVAVLLEVIGVLERRSRA